MEDVDITVTIPAAAATKIMEWARLINPEVTTAQLRTALENAARDGMKSEVRDWVGRWAMGQLDSKSEEVEVEFGGI